MLRSLLLRGAVGLAALSFAAPARAQATPRLELEPYKFKAGRGRKVEAELGTLTVPYDRSDPDSVTIELKFVRFPATTRRSGPPIVYLAGGPGGSGIGAARGTRFPLFDRLRELGDVIAFDQRGTGASEPRVRIEATVDAPYEGLVTREWLEREYDRALAEAGAQFERDGFDPAPLDTNASADDLEDLRVALGVAKLRLWGISYGTHLALATLKRHPDAVDSMVLAGVEGLDDTLKLPSQVDAPIRALSAEVARHPFYGERIPDLAALLREVFERADNEPFAIEIEHPETKEVVTTRFGRLDLETVTWSALKRRDLMGGIPATFLALKAGDTESLAPVVGWTRGKGSHANAMSLAMDGASGASAGRIRRIEREEDGSLFGHSMNFRTRAVQRSFPVPDLGDAFREPARSDVPVLCISGEMDVRTPPSRAEAVLAGFPNGRHLILERAAHDHDLLVSSPKIAECIVAFFRGEELPYERITLPPIEFALPD